jgi:formylmethanofuran dehydrogenase subunit C
LVSLRPRYLFKIPVEAQTISPDEFAGKTLGEIEKLQAWEGNRQLTLGELFQIEGESATKPEEINIHIHGEIEKVRRIGFGMSAGEITIFKDAGFHLGEEMKGGKITVEGSADSWLGAMMKNGTIEVKGNAGDYVGAAYRGSVKGMRGGTIIIQGNAGNELGYYMRKGLIKVHGNTAQFAGLHMKKGLIHIKGNSKGRVGAEMTGGKIIVEGTLPEVLPTFLIDNIKPKVKANGEEVAGPFYVFVGDSVEEGEGKLYVSKPMNAHLKFYEQFL